MPMRRMAGAVSRGCAWSIDRLGMVSALRYHDKATPTTGEVAIPIA